MSRHELALQRDVAQQVVAATSSRRNELSATCRATSWSQRVVVSPLTLNSNDNKKLEKANRSAKRKATKSKRAMTKATSRSFLQGPAVPSRGTSGYPLVPTQRLSYSLPDYATESYQEAVSSPEAANHTRLMSWLWQDGPLKRFCPNAAVSPPRWHPFDIGTVS